MHLIRFEVSCQFPTSVPYLLSSLCAKDSGPTFGLSPATNETGRGVRVPPPQRKVDVRLHCSFRALVSKLSKGYGFAVCVKWTSASVSQTLSANVETRVTHTHTHTHHNKANSHNKSHINHHEHPPCCYMCCNKRNQKEQTNVEENRRY